MLHKYSSSQIPFSRSFHCFQHYPPSHKFHTIRTFFTHQSQYSLFIYRFALPTIGNNLTTFGIFTIPNKSKKIISIIFSQFLTKSQFSLFSPFLRHTFQSQHFCNSPLKLFSPIQMIFSIFFTIFHYSMRYHSTH
jgi:hypothetical protein